MSQTSLIKMTIDRYHWANEPYGPHKAHKTNKTHKPHETHMPHKTNKPH